MNQAAEAGLSGARGMGQTAAWGDFNGDGLQDLVVGSFHTKSRNIFLFKNNGDGTFSDVTKSSGLRDTRSRAVAWGDYNNDGHLDLAIGTIMAGAPPLVYKNASGASFVEVSEGAGITRKGGVIYHIAWVDFNGDGFLDLFQANDGVSYLYRNNRDGTFTEVSSEVGLGKPLRTKSAIWFDYNNDGFSDLFLANNGLNRLFMNKGGQSLIDVTAKAGVAGDQKWHSVSTCAGDINGDGYMDLYVGNITSERNALYLNNGDGTFVDVTLKSGTGDVGDARSCAMVDFDADGRLDIMSTNHLSPTLLYRNSGGGRFTEVGTRVGVKVPVDVFSTTWGDYNRDGFMDAFQIGHMGEALFRNKGSANNSLILKLVGNGRRTNVSAIGARVEVKSPAGMQIREVSGGKGCCEQDMLPVHFGLGRDSRADIVVKWSGGGSCIFKGVDVKGGKLFSVKEDGCAITTDITTDAKAPGG